MVYTYGQMSVSLSGREERGLLTHHVPASPG